MHVKRQAKKVLNLLKLDKMQRGLNLFIIQIYLTEKLTHMAYLSVTNEKTFPLK